MSLQTYARAGITDLYLETFYHGLSTGKQGVFNRRFATDYLASAIPLAARYNIRVHAWVEAGYWQYNNTGSYNFSNNPEWRVLSIATGLPGGDISGQVFANLGHPGVQAKLRAYTAELAAYPGLWGVQTDYHRFPVDDNTSSPNVHPAPWSYDNWSQAAFRTSIGNATVNIYTQAITSSGAFWNQYLTFRRNGVSEAARQMYLGIQEASDDVVFSAAVFPNTINDTAQISKCQDWAPWCANNYLDHAVPMAYAGLSSIDDQLNIAKSLAGNKKVVAGLAITGGHAPAVDQLNVTKTVNVHDFIFFEGSMITAANEAGIKTWVDNSVNTPRMRADLNDNLVLDTADYNAFLALYSGSSVPALSTDRANLDADSDIDSQDHRLMRAAIAQYRLGAFGKLTAGDRQQFELARTAAPAVGSSVKNLFDFDIDGDVDNADSRTMERMGWEGPFAFVQVQLGDWTAGLNGREITFEWTTSAGVPLFVWSETLPADGRVSIPAPGGVSAQLSVREDQWLRRTVSLNMGSTDANGIVLNLVNGDIDQSGEVDAADIDQAISQFGSTVPSLSDVNGSGEVDAADIDIVIAHFGATDD